MWNVSYNIIMRFNGVAEAVKALSGLDQTSQERIIKEIAEKDPQMAELLANNLISIDDLKFLTTDMIRTLLKDIDPGLMALGLKGQDQEVIDHFLNNISKNMKQDMLDVLEGPKRKLSEVKDAQEKILAIVKEKKKKGEIIINRNADEEYV